MSKHDPVNHPSHYISHPSGVECIEVTRHMTFNLGNAVKYLWRNGLKDGQPQVQDLRKAIWYIEDEIKRLGKSGDEMLQQSIDNLACWSKIEVLREYPTDPEQKIEVKTRNGMSFVVKFGELSNDPCDFYTHYRFVE